MRARLAQGHGLELQPVKNWDLDALTAGKEPVKEMMSLALAERKAAGAGMTIPENGERCCRAEQRRPWGR